MMEISRIEYDEVRTDTLTDEIPDGSSYERRYSVVAAHGILTDLVVFP